MFQVLHTIEHPWIANGKTEEQTITIVTCCSDSARLSLYANGTGKIILAIPSQSSRHTKGLQFKGVVAANDSAQLRLPGIGWRSVGGQKIGEETERFTRD